MRDYASLDFMTKYTSLQTTEERHRMIHALLNRLDTYEIADAIAEARRRPVMLLTPEQRQRRQYGRRPFAGVGVFVFAQGMLMLQKRISTPARGHGEWALAGGKQEYQQTLEDAAAAELYEECNLKAETFTQLYTASTVFADGVQYNTTYLIAERVSGNYVNKEPNKCEGAYLFPFQKLPKPLFSATEYALKRFGRTISAHARKSMDVRIEGLFPFGTSVAVSSA